MASVNHDGRDAHDGKLRSMGIDSRRDSEKVVSFLFME